MKQRAVNLATVNANPAGEIEGRASVSAEGLGLSEPLAFASIVSQFNLFAKRLDPRSYHFPGRRDWEGEIISVCAA
jgi:hypothetical protein